MNQQLEQGELDEILGGKQVSTLIEPHGRCLGYKVLSMACFSQNRCPFDLGFT